MIPTKATIPTGDFGYIAKLYVRDQDVFAIGGHEGVPTLLWSLDGGQTFESCWGREPRVRDVFLDKKQVWTVGEWAWLGVSKLQELHRDSDDPTDDTSIPAFRIKQLINLCRVEMVGGVSTLYTLARDPNGRSWITGDVGLVLRSKNATGRTFDLIPSKTKGSIHALYIDPLDGKPWLLDTTGIAQRWNGKRFAVIATPAASSLNGMLRTPAGTLLIAANDGAVFRSTTNGASWTTITTTRAHLDTLAVTRYGIFATGARGTLLVSYDDGASWARVKCKLEERLSAIAVGADGIVVGGERGAIYRFSRRDLAELMHATCGDKVLAGLAAKIRDGDLASEVVLEDALRERSLW